MLRLISVRNFLLIFWFLLCSITLYSYINGHNQGGEYSELFTLKMLALTFPFGYLGGILAEYSFQALSFYGVVLSETILIWLFMALSGYFQWFVMIPYFWALSNKRRLR